MNSLPHDRKSTDGNPSSIASTDLAALRQRVQELIRKLKRDLLEREEAVRLCVLSALAGESVFLLGPPGVAKSLIARRIKHLFHKEAKSFEYLMNRFSTPDEIFGPVSISGLKEGRLERETKGYLPEAKVAFLDEIWKAGPSIQNALLTAINERVFRNSGKMQEIPLRALISASNELPAEGEGLEALWDRFLVRLEVDNVVVPESRHHLIRGHRNVGSSQEDLDISDEERFTDDDLKVLDELIDETVIPDVVLSIIDQVIKRLAQLKDDQSSNDGGLAFIEEGSGGKQPMVVVSDRRWKKIGRLLRASAACNGRRAVDWLDCYLISYCIWHDQKHIQEARRIVLEAIEDTVGPDSAVLADLHRRWVSLRRRAESLPHTTYHEPSLYSGHYKIDLSEHGDLLKDDTHGMFGRIPKDAYESLGHTFNPIKLHPLSSDGSGKRKRTVQACVLAKRGSHPCEVLLKKEDKERPLRPFRTIAFSLNHAAAKTKKTVLVKNHLSSKLAQEAKALCDEVSAHLEGNDGGGRLPGHLFLDLPDDVVDRLTNVRLQEQEALDALHEVIKAFQAELSHR